MIPTKQRIQKEIRDLRSFIDDEDNELLKRRFAQVAEDTLRWSIEDTTDWDTPLENARLMANIVRAENEL